MRGGTTATLVRSWPRAVAAAALAGFLALSGSASADMPGPNDDDCTLARQSARGAKCEECYQSVGDPAASWCSARMPAKGLSLRCGVGATHRRSIWCDRPPP